MLKGKGAKGVEIGQCKSDVKSRELNQKQKSLELNKK